MSQPRITLDVTEGPHAGAHIEFLEPATCLVGRGRQADLRLRDDPWFSRVHFRLEVLPPSCRLMDLDSSNGTEVNGERSDVRMLRDGDVISGGKTRIVVRIEVGASTGEMPDTIALPAEAKLPDALAATRGPRAEATSAGGRMPVGTKSQPVSSWLHIPGYEDLEEIGRGGMGVVYRARRKATGGICAIKVTKPGGEAGVAAQFFHREANVLSGLVHRRIVRFHEFGDAEGALYYSMEYVQTVDVREVLATRSQNTRVRVLCGLASQVLEALEFTHDKGVVHRDIKPANILVAQQSGRLTTKVTDFGLAKSFENAGYSGLTSEGELRGTIPFMPPEQILDSRFAKPTCDLYAVGAMLYLWLSGRFPYEMTNVRSALRDIQDEQVPPLSLDETGPALPPGLAAVVDRAVAKSASDRYADAAEMRRALAPFTRP